MRMQLIVTSGMRAEAGGTARFEMNGCAAIQAARRSPMRRSTSPMSVSPVRGKMNSSTPESQLSMKLVAGAEIQI